MPRFSKQATMSPLPAQLAMDELVREAKEEAARWSEVSKGTRLTYEQNARQLAEGWDMANAAKGTRYAMRAAGLWSMRKALKRSLKDAEKARKNGITGQELQPVREAIFNKKMVEVKKQLSAIYAFSALPWSEQLETTLKKQKPHKQKAATDFQLVKFFDAAANSSFFEPLLVTEFSGARGHEFKAGVRLELVKIKRVPTLKFFIQSAKANGKEKGLDLRCIESPFPNDADPEVKRRWLKLAKLVKPGKSHVVRIEPTEKMTAGQRFTQACKFIAKKADVAVAAYSLRHRFSAQMKASTGGNAELVALALGHQTTETQRHYGRASRGGGSISPTNAIGVQVGSQMVRGPGTRSGPAQHVQQKTQLKASTPAATAPSSRPKDSRL